MERTGCFSMRLCILGFYLCFATICIVHSDAKNAVHRYKARRHFRRPNTKWTRRNHFHAFRKFDMNMPLDDTSNTDPYSLSPYDAQSPFSLPQNGSPYCINPPSTPQPPSTNPPSLPQPPSTTPIPIGGYTPLPPPGSSSNPPSSPGITLPIPPESSPVLSPPTTSTTPIEPIFSPPFYEPSPPEGTPISNPPAIVPIPPSIVSNPPTTSPMPTVPVFSPPVYEPSPPYNVPSPTGAIPRSPRFLPPIVYPPPAVPPPPYRVPTSAMWCVAKPAVPDPIIQEAMNYACGSGADCAQIQSSGSCYQPDTLFAHASYAFNSYWQRTKATGGMCDFGGTAILVSVDPSYDGCRFIYF